jgi:Holliday junction resolvase RusA-like endonuclease
MPFIAFEVLGEPKSQPRPKAARRGRFIHVYTPATAKKWKGLVASAAKPFLASKLTGPLSLELDFTFLRPKSHYTSKGLFTKRAPKDHTKKPDVDNLAKAVMDALTDAGLWEDDDQIVSLRVTKKYALSEGVSVFVCPATTSPAQSAVQETLSLTTETKASTASPADTPPKETAKCLPTTLPKSPPSGSPSSTAKRKRSQSVSSPSEPVKSGATP